jgi:hypothetical protein
MFITLPSQTSPKFFISLTAQKIHVYVEKLLAHLPTMLPVQISALCLLLPNNIREIKRQSLLFNSFISESIYSTTLFYTFFF